MDAAHDEAEAFAGPVDHLSALLDRMRKLLRLRIAQRRAYEDPEARSVAETLPGQLRRDSVALQARVRASERAGVELPVVALARRLELSEAEVDVVVLGMTPLLDPTFKSLLPELDGQERNDLVDVERVVAILGDSVAERLAVRAGFSRDGKLVRERIVQLRDSRYARDPSRYEVRVPPWVVNTLAGRPVVESGIVAVARLDEPPETLERVVLPPWRDEVVRLLEGFEDYADRLQSWGLETAIPYGRGLVVLFTGPPGTGKTLFARALSNHTGRPLLTVNTSRLLDEPNHAPELVEQMVFEARLHDALLFFDDCEQLFARGSSLFYDNLHLLERYQGVILLALNADVRLDPALERRVTYHARFRLPGASDREAIWRAHLPADLPLHPEVDLQALAETYELAGGHIKNAVLVAVNKALAGRQGDAVVEEAHLRAAAEAQLRHRLDDFGDALRPNLSLEDVILDSDVMEGILEILDACRHNRTVLHQWGLGRRLATGRGVVALFDGPPGTGKTLTCEVLAAELGRPLQRIHMAQVVSKWVGETEKHIQHIFREARASNAILLFDEADALFGARVQQVQSAQDRYVNMETNQLLAEIERFDGVVLLTTNLETNMDPAFKRRIHFTVTFDEPEAPERAGIWQRLVPPWLPHEGPLDFEELAEAFDMPGGNIKNAVLRACYDAISEGEVLQQRHLMDAAERECEEAGRLVRRE